MAGRPPGAWPPLSFPFPPPPSSPRTTSGAGGEPPRGDDAPAGAGGANPSVFPAAAAANPDAAAAYHLPDAAFHSASAAACHLPGATDPSSVPAAAAGGVRAAPTGAAAPASLGGPPSSAAQAAAPPLLRAVQDVPPAMGADAATLGADGPPPVVAAGQDAGAHDRSTPIPKSELSRPMASCSPAATDSEGVANSRLPAWILLDLVGYIDDDGERGNSTTAEARTSSWQSEGVRVSFFTADPPRLSHFSIHVPSRTKRPALRGRPSILQSVDNLALIDVTFSCGYRIETEYFVYRAGVHGQRPSLEYLGYVSDYLKEVPGVASVGILPNDGDCGFAVVAIVVTPVDGQCGLHIYRAEGDTWTNKVHLFEYHQLANINLSNIEKVIALGWGEIGFVDLWKGILVFNVLQEKPMPHFVPLPTSLPGNKFDSQLGCSARLFRDVILSTDGSLNCVEIEACWRRILHKRPRHFVSDELPQDLWHNDVLHDSDLMLHHTSDKEDVTKEAKETYEYVGWRVIAWSRELSSTCWHKKCFFHAKDIVTNPIHAAFSCELQLRGTSSHTLTLKDLFVSFPTLSMDGSILYIMCRVKISDQEFRVVTVDIGSNSLEEFSPILTEQPYLFKTITCDLFKYMKSDSDGTQIGGDDASQMTSSALEPTEKSGGIKLIRPNNRDLRLEDFGCPTWTVPFFCNYQLQPHQSLPLSVTQIGGEDASWWTSSISRATEENVNQWHGQQQQQHHPPAVPHRCQQSPPDEIEEAGEKTNATVEPSDNY